MKIKLFEFTLTCFFIMSNVIMFAQPGNDDDNGGLEDDDPPAAPISGKLLILAFVAIVYAFYIFHKQRKLVK